MDSPLQILLAAEENVCYNNVKQEGSYMVSIRP